MAPVRHALQPPPWMFALFLICAGTSFSLLYECALQACAVSVHLRTDTKPQSATKPHSAPENDRACRATGEVQTAAASDLAAPPVAPAATMESLDTAPTVLGGVIAPPTLAAAAPGEGMDEAAAELTRLTSCVQEMDFVAHKLEVHVAAAAARQPPAPGPVSDR